MEKNTFLVRTNLVNIVIKTEYKILSVAFLQKIQAKLLEMYGKDASISIDHLKHRVQQLYTFEKDDWNNYDISYENGIGTLKGDTVVIVNI